jgi:hypothetical protein
MHRVKLTISVTHRVSLSLVSIDTFFTGLGIGFLVIQGHQFVVSN